MSPINLGLSDQLRGLLAAGNTLSVKQMQAATGKSQPSLSLALTGMGSQVCKMGAARSTRYALAHTILGLPARQPISLTMPSGEVLAFGELTYLQNQAVHVRTKSGPEWLGAPGQLPWFLQPLRPQGFLGRRLVRLRPDLPGDPDDWSAEQVLYMATHHAGNPPGAFSLGDVMGRSVPDVPVAKSARLRQYDTLARDVGNTLPAASSAGGEQPKFLVEFGGGSGAETSHRHCIVKFSPPRGTPFGERWHDLLHLEYLALTVLAEQGIAVAKIRVLESKVRTYLESERFDRVGREGKRHVVAANAVHGEFLKTPRQHWVASAEALVAQKLLTQEHLQTIACTYLFGQYIGNTDMHFGNLSFFVDDVAKPVLLPTPVYDMLPMLWRPGVHGGELDADPVRAQLQPAGYGAEAKKAHTWALEFWERAGQLAALSPQIKKASAASALRLLKAPKPA